MKKKNILIVIPCCKRKIDGGQPAYNNANCISNGLSDNERQRLFALRKQAFSSFGYVDGPETGSPNNENIDFLEAFRRYNGRLYQQISSESWERLGNIENLDMVIVSALYGLLKYNEPIRFYDNIMTDQIRDVNGNNIRLYTWWRRNGLCRILSDYINRNNFTFVHNLLSLNYNRSLGNCNIRFISFHRDLHAGNGTLTRRGHWINKFIQSF